MSSDPAPTPWVKLTSAPDWGFGAAGDRVTVNFVDAGKHVIQLDAATREPVERPGDDS